MERELFDAIMFLFGCVAGMLLVALAIVVIGGTSAYTIRLVENILMRNSTIPNPLNRAVRKGLFRAVCTALVAIATILGGYGAYKAALEAERANNLKQQELELLRERK